MSLTYEDAVKIVCTRMIREDDVGALDYALKLGHRLDAPMKDYDERLTLLHVAVKRGAVKVTQALLNVPGLNINQTSKSGLTPFAQACVMSDENETNLCVFKLLLADKRTDLELRAGMNDPLQLLFFKKRHDLIEWWIASGRELPLRGEHAFWVSINNDGQLMYAPREASQQISDLLDSYKADEHGVRHRIRKTLGFKEDLAAEWFALIIFAADGILALRDQSKESNAGRFLTMTLGLPLELQMILCHRIVDSAANLIKSTPSEQAFRQLGQSLS